MFGSALGRWRIGSLLGFPVEVSWSFALLLVVALLAFGGGLATVFVILLAFASVLLHELGHAVVARQLGVQVSGIELGFFGGAAKMVQMPRSANHEIAIAAAGPAVSLVLAGLGFGLGALTSVALFAMIGWINLTIALFNLLPALPMDGGRILRALLTRRMDFVSATDTAVKVARGFAIGFGVLGLASGTFQLLLLAPMLWMMGTQERWFARQLASQYVRTSEGYAQRPSEWVDVMPRGAWERLGRFGEPAWRDPRPGARGGPGGPGPRVWLRNVGGRWVVEVR
ncbi:MAG: site-2 protease family protein [Kofleriaceae bacterium]